MPKFLFATTLSFIAVTWTYFLILTVRANYWEHGTSITSIPILAMYACCLAASILSIYLNIADKLPRYLTTALLIVALIPTVGFFFLNISGIVCEKKKGNKCEPIELRFVNFGYINNDSSDE